MLSNLEVNFNVLDAGFASELGRQLESDIAKSRELDLNSWQLRPYADKVVERFFYLFRYLF